jgi:hypothetical protein
MKKTTITLQVKVLLHTDEDVTTQDIVNELDVTIRDTTGKAEITDTEILGFEVTDSR